MKVFITGVSGFLGSHVVTRLMTHGHTLMGTMRRAGMASMDSKRRLKKLEALDSTSSKLQIVRADEYEGLYNTLQKFRPEICIHLAGKSWVRESIDHPDLYQEANHRYTAALLEALRQSGCRRVIFASSVMVYGKDAPLPYEESHLGGAPVSPYGASKLACEVLLNTYSSLYKMETVNLRIFSAYGPELRPDQVHYIIANAILKKQHFSVFGDGSSMRDYIEVEDVVSAIESAMRVHGSHHALNIGSGFGTTLLELLRGIEHALGQKALVIQKPPIPGELHAAIPDISMAMEKLNWEPKVELHEGLDRFARWFKTLDSSPLPSASK